MDPQDVDRAFAEAMGLEGQAREAFLAKLDETLRAEIEELLGAAEQADQKGFLEGNLSSPSAIDRYQILRKLGEGGMGDVFLAEQSEPVSRTVAIKLIKKGMDSKQVIERFETERQALAMMDHPNIAKVFDAGITDSGQPFFAMEYVEGDKLTEYCDTQGLGLAARLELFVQVCQAVQHAHQKGIIHRDLKPTNILVTEYDGQPTVKVIDFGLAKAIEGRLADRTVFTGIGQVLGTFAYMSPEQSDGNSVDVDTRADVYSLGVVLYELLTGSTPLSREKLRQEGLELILRMIREEEAPRPSSRLVDSEDSATIAKRRRTDTRQLSLVLRGDLDWIAMKALEKDRDRRYASISALGNDIQRFLSHEPVEARPPSLVYRFRKAGQKYRRLFLTASTMLALLVLGLIGTTTFWLRATKLAEISELRRQIDTQLAQQNRPLGAFGVEEADALLTLARQLTALDDAHGENARRSILQSLADALRERLAAERISDPELRLIENDLGQLTVLHQRAGEPLVADLIDELNQSLQNRRRDWRIEYATASPPIPEDFAALESQGIAADGGNFLQTQASGFVALPAPLRTGNQELVVTFADGLDATTAVGLVLNRQVRGGHYRFIVSSQPIADGAELGAELGADTPSLPTFEGNSGTNDGLDDVPDLRRAITEDLPVFATLLRSDRVLASQRVVVQGRRLEMRARKEQNTLQLFLNGKPTLIFDDAFSLPMVKDSQVGVLWPKDVAVSGYQLRTQPLESEAPSNLERADALYAAGDLAEAELFYGRVDSDEARYKRAVCLKALRRSGSLEQFKSLASRQPTSDADSRWHLLALLQVLDSSGGSDPILFQDAMTNLSGFYKHRLSYVLKVAPRDLQEELLRFLQKDGSRWRISAAPKGDIEELELAAALQEEQQVTPERIRATKWRLADAYRIQGRIIEAKEILDELILETEPSRGRSREYAALVSDRCWIDFVADDVEAAEQRLLAVLAAYQGEVVPAPLALVYVDLARSRLIRGDASQAAAYIESFFALATPSSASHGEYAEAALVGGLAYSKQEDAEKALATYRKGLRSLWRGTLNELDEREAAFGLALIDAHKSIEGEAFLQPLAQDQSTNEIRRGIMKDINASGIGLAQLSGIVLPFLKKDETFRSVVDGMFEFPGGQAIREELILHQRPLKDQFRIPLVSILFEGIRSLAFQDVPFTDEMIIAGRSVCGELADLYDQERIDPSQHFSTIATAYFGLMTDKGWQEMNELLPPRVTSVLALVYAQWLRNNGNRNRALQFYQIAIDSEATPTPFKDWAQEQVEVLNAATR